MKYQSKLELGKLLAIDDLTEDVHGHAISIMKNDLIRGLCELGYPLPEILTGPRIVAAEDNYALLGYSNEEATLGEVHTKWIDANNLLRTQTTALIPEWLKRQAVSKVSGMALAPGVTYRRDTRDKTHTGTPHQMDVWIMGERCMYGKEALLRLVTDILNIAIPGLKEEDVVINDSPHHYTEEGIEINVRSPWGDLIEVMECGLIASSLCSRMGISDSKGGLALGMGLDRLVMIRKNIQDIRLLRHGDPRIACQMRNLLSYKEVSMQPCSTRDLSVACARDLSEEDVAEICEKIMEENSMGNILESVRILSRHSIQDLSPIVIERLGMTQGTENLLIRITLRDPATSISKSQANKAYAILQNALHSGVDGKGYLLS